MKFFLIFILFLSSSLFAEKTQREIRTEAAIQKALEQEQLFAREQTFYDRYSYDFNASKVDEESLKYVPILEIDYDFDMDDVYD